MAGTRGGRKATGKADGKVGSRSESRAAAAAEADEEKQYIAAFSRRVIQEKSGNYQYLKRSLDGSIVYPSAHGTTTNRGNKLLQGSEYISRTVLDASRPLVPGSVFYNGSEHRLLQRRRAGLNRSTRNMEQDISGTEFDILDDEEQVNLSKEVDVQQILAPISSLADIANKGPILRTFSSNLLRELEFQCSRMIERDQLSVNKYAALLDIFLGEHPEPLYEEGLRLPLYDHALSLNEESESDLASQDQPANNMPSDNTAIPTQSEETNSKLGSQMARPTAQTTFTKDNKGSLDEPENSGSDIKDSYTNSIEIGNTSHETIVNTTDSIEPHTESLGTDNMQSELPLVDKGRKHDEKIENDLEDPFFALPRVLPTRALASLLTKSDQPEVIEEIESARQLVQIALQRNQEFVRNLQEIRGFLLKAERIRERILAWSKEYAGIPEDGVTVPSALKVVKRGLISATTNKTMMENIPLEDDPNEMNVIEE